MDVVRKKLNKNFINIRIAHRGLHSEKVCENSMEAFRLAIEGGYAIEIDVHLTKDGDLAVVHDSFLSRVTGKSGVVERLSAEELKDYRLRDGQRIPMLTDVLRLVDGRVPLLIELKFRRSFNEKQADVLLAQLESYKRKDMIAMQSFHPKAVKYLKEHTDEYSVGYLSSYGLIKNHNFLNYMLKSLRFYRYMHADFVSYDINYLPNKYVNAKRKRGVQVLGITKAYRGAVYPDGGVPVQDIAVTQNLGVYGGYIAVQIYDDNKDGGEKYDYSVGGVTICEANASLSLWLYGDGELVPLDKAYADGLVSLSDIAGMASLYIS